MFLRLEVMVDWCCLMSCSSRRILSMSTLALTGTVTALASAAAFLRLTKGRRSGLSLRKYLFSNSSALLLSAWRPDSVFCTLLNPYMFNWRMKLAKLLCLKKRGSTTLAKSSGR